jgi:hypothetical protein
VSELPHEPVDLSGFDFADPTGVRRDLDTFLVDQCTDALLVWANGRVCFEAYRNGHGPRSRHLVFSVTKSFTGLLAEMLIHDGRLDDQALVSDLVPELRASGAYGDATVRDVLDMEVGIDFSEVYEDPQSDIRQFAYAAGMRAVPDGVAAPASLYDYLPTLRKQGEHGVDFHYVTANSEVLGWVIERITDTPIAELFADRVYGRIGAERDAFYMTDPMGKAVAGGGMCITAPDLLRLGLLVAHDGEWNGQRIVPADVIRRIKAGGTPRPSLWGNEGGLEICSYRSQWYLNHPWRVLSAMGVHGQTIHISLDHDVVMVGQSSHPIADGDFFGVTDCCFAALVEHLAG